MKHGRSVLIFWDKNHILSPALPQGFGDLTSRFDHHGTFPCEKLCFARSLEKDNDEGKTGKNM